MIAAAAVFTFLLLACCLLNLFTLPGNWILAALAAAWAFFIPDSGMGLLFFLVLIGLGMLGEAAEFGLQLRDGKKYGSSKTASVAGIIGAMAGAFAGASFLFGLGAIFGALLGAWTGCYLAERLLMGLPHDTALRSAHGAMRGRFFGMILKFGIGMGMFAWTASHVWQNL